MKRTHVSRTLLSGSLLAKWHVRGFSPMKTTVRFTFAWALALIAFVSPSFAQKDGPVVPWHLEFEITVTTQKSTAYVWGSEHVPLVSYSIKNKSLIAGQVRAIELDHSWTVGSLFIEDGDRLIQANQFVKGGGIAAQVSITIPAGGTYELRVRGSIIHRFGSNQISDRSEVWARFVSLDIVSGEDGSSLSFNYPNWNIPTHAVVDSLPTMPVVSNSSGLSKLQNVSAYGFVVTGDRFMKTKVLVRVAGPALADLGINDGLSDPTVHVINSKGENVGNNDDWSMPSERRFREVGAFPFKRDSYDAAVEVDLLPGSYTVQVKPASGPATGSFIIETYQLPEVTSAASVFIPSPPPNSGKG